jgi:membrane-associated protease RseP (regulator of RpoE activity)
MPFFRDSFFGPEIFGRVPKNGASATPGLFPGESDVTIDVLLTEYMGRLVMEIQHALVKDLRSTGYFFDELKNYSESPEMDVTTYCIKFAVPYLVKISESYDRSGKPARSKILRLAIEHLSNFGDYEIVDSIFGLKKVAVAEIEKICKAALQEQLDKSRTLANRQRLESAEFLIKLLVSIIRIFRLTEPNAKQRQADGVEDPVGDAIVQSWAILEPAGA